MTKSCVYLVSVGADNRDLSLQNIPVEVSELKELILYHKHFDSYLLHRLGDLASYVQKSTVGPKSRWMMLSHICSAMEYLEDLGVVHNDLVR